MFVRNASYRVLCFYHQERLSLRNETMPVLSLIVAKDRVSTAVKTIDIHMNIRHRQIRLNTGKF
jgi:hypothetical protein